MDRADYIAAGRLSNNIRDLRRFTQAGSDVRPPMTDEYLGLQDKIHQSETYKKRIGELNPALAQDYVLPGFEEYDNAPMPFMATNRPQPKMMRVNGPGEIAVNFPNGTDHQTIDRVMRQAMQTQGANGRIAGAFDASQSVEQRPAPTAWSASVMPFSVDTQGNKNYFDTNAGIPGIVKRFLNPPANPMGPGGSATPEAVVWGANAAMLASPASAAMKAGERMIPGVAQSLRREKVAVPSEEELHAAGSTGYDTARGMGVQYDPKAVAQMASTIGADLERDGINPIVAPKSFRLLEMLRSPSAGAKADISDLHTAKRAFRNAAKDFTNPTEQLAASKVIEQLDRFVKEPDAATVVAGPAVAAGKAQADADANYAAAMRSRQVSGKKDIAELNTKTANSGANIDNDLRRRVRDILKSKKDRAGFSEKELSMMRNFVLGDKRRNTTRFVANLLGGGGGMGSVAAAIAGGMGGGQIGGLPGAVAGVGLPLAGFGLKAAQNKMARTGMGKIDEAVRMRSPLYQSRAAEAPAVPISPEKRAMLMRAMMLYGPNALGPPQGGW